MGLMEDRPATAAMQGPDEVSCSRARKEYKSVSTNTQAFSDSETGLGQMHCDAPPSDQKSASTNTETSVNAKVV